jgi:hypothetical protein
MTDIEPLSADLSNLLAREKARVAVSPERTEELLARVERNAAVVAAVGGLGMGAALAVNAAKVSILQKILTNLARAKTAVAIAAFAAGGVTGGVVTHAVETRTTVAPTPTASPSPRPAVVASAIPAPAPEASIAPEASTAPDASALPTAPSAPPSAAQVSASTLDTERTLVDRGRAALAKGDADAALRALGEHERRFPAGSLAEERDALTVRALVVAGRKSDASRRLGAFEKRYPSSLFTKGLRGAVGE